MRFWQSHLSTARIALILVVLALFFSIDDLLMLFLLRKSNLVQLHSAWYTVFYFTTLFGSILIALLVFEALRQRPVTGVEGLLASKGRVIGLNQAGYQVKIAGEIWQAVSRERLEVGEEVEVISVEGLVVRVERS